MSVSVTTISSPSRTQLLSAYLGNLFEHYDTALFGFLAAFLAPLIFPQQDALTALIWTYAIIPLGMLARPIGSFVFGYIGDTYGRQRALFFSLVGISVVSGLIALTPTYSQVGLLAPIIFALGRILQNFFAAGEIMGGAIFLLEHSKKGQQDFLSSLYGASTIAGILLASAGVALLGYYDQIDPHWRLLYLFGCITSLFGCLLRRQSVAFTPAINSRRFSQSLPELLKMLWLYRKPLCLIAICGGFYYANYSIALVLMNGFIPLVSSFTKTEIMELNTLLLIFDFAALPFFGWLASKISREKIMLLASLSVLVWAIPLFLLLEQATLMHVVVIRICCVVLGVAFTAPFHAWAQQLVPEHCRYGVISCAYAIGSQAIGSPTVAISLWCFQQTGMIASAAWYWMVLAAVSSIAILLGLRKQSL